MIKLIATDLDGTLLDANHHLQDLEKSLINDLISKGYEFTFATGRSINSVKSFCQGLDVNLVLLNGAVVYDKYLQLIYDSFLNDAIALKIIAKLQKYRQHFIVYSQNESYCSNLIKQAIMTFLYSKSIKKSLAIFKDFKLFKKCDFKVYKIEFVSTNQKLFNSLYQIKDITILKAGKYSYEITSTKASKKAGLLALIKHKNINEDEVLCFGDNENDISMLKHFKHSYVMGNASLSIQKQFKNIIGKNSEHSVYFKIKELIYEK